MKRLSVGLMCILLLTSCEINTTKAKSEVDSTVNKLDAAAERVGEKADEVWDSTKSKAKDLKEELDSTFDKKK